MTNSLPQFQLPQEIVRLEQSAGWELWEGRPTYDEGARDKYSVVSPKPAEFDFLRPGYRYLLKHSRDKYPWQFWMEIIAYRFGCLIGVPVPPAHVAIGFEEDIGSLSEWMYATGWKPDRPEKRVVMEGLDQGGDLLLAHNPSYDRTKGRRPGDCHNLHDVRTVLSQSDRGFGPVSNWESALAKILAFDFLIANTDRHHDNWGVIKVWEVSRKDHREGKEGRVPIGRVLSPAFDNGTSLGHERLEEKIPNLLKDNSWFRGHATGPRARHHMCVSRDDTEGAGYLELLESIVTHTDTKVVESVRECVDFQIGDVEAMLDSLREFDVPVPLSKNRADFILGIIRARQPLLQEFVDQYA